MSLILIPGTSGSGKSHMMFQRVLREAQEHPEQRFVVLVPEQNTLQTQKKLVAMSGRGGIWNIDVLSFTRLAYRVFEQTGVRKHRILSETGKILLLRLIAAREGARIPILSGVLDRPGVLNEMKSILSEMDQYGIGQEELLRMERQVSEDGRHPALTRKLSEIALLQEAFERYQEGHYITGEKQLLVLCEKIPLDETLRGAVFCLDGFTGLTPAQLQAVTALLGVAKELLVSVTIAPDQMPISGADQKTAPGPQSMDSWGLFALSQRTVQALVHCAKQAHCAVEVLPVMPGNGGRHAAGGELAWLEMHLLRDGKEGRRPFPASGSRPEIFLRQCADPWDEAVSAAVTISELIRKGIRYREIAIVCGSLKDYAEYVRRAMSVYEIPCYIDRSSTVVMNPAFEFVRCAVDVLEKNFSYESVMALLRTGLVLDPDDGGIDLLENYILAAGIRGYSMWSKPFVRQTRDRNQELLEAASAPRASFMEKFEPFAQTMKKSRAPFCEYAKALWTLVLACDLPGKLDILGKQRMEAGRQERAQEYEAVLGVISSVLDEAVLLMGEETVTRSQFSEILRAGFAEAKIGILPRGIDQVQVGDLERSRLEDIRVVLFLGMNDGYVPRRKLAGGVLTDLEREYLLSQNVHLAPTARQEANIQQFYLYLVLTRPSEALYLSWSMAGTDAKELRPSGIVNTIQTLFPAVSWVSASSALPFDSVTSLETGRNVLFQALGDYLHGERIPAEWNRAKLKELIRLYLTKEEKWKGRAEAFLQSICANDRKTDLDEETALALYGSVLKGSITRLEEFSACAFRHFADYGLQLKEREVFALRSLETGNLLHKAVELFSRKLGGREFPYGWRDLPEDQRDNLARECLAQALEEAHAAQLYLDSARSAETLARCEQIFLRSVKTLQRQIQAGVFEPVRFELSFGKEDSDMVWIEDLPGGKKLALSGKIDRIDTCAGEGTETIYVKIVDYKSSSREIDLESLIEGEQLQLIVYMDAAAKLSRRKDPDREVVCAGAFYFSFLDPVVGITPQMTEDQIQDAIDASMRVKGLVNSRKDVIERLDAQPWAPGASKVIPVTKNKAQGEVRAAGHIISDRQFSLLRDYAAHRMREIASDILSGQTAPNPSRKDSNTTACTWCPYRDVCGFDPRSRGMAYREKAGRSPEKIWEVIEEGALMPEQKDKGHPGG